MVEKTLGDVATYINGRAFKPQEWETSGRPIIRIQNLTNSTQECNRTTKQFEEKYRISDGDLLFAWSASLGAHIWHGEDGWLNQHIFVDECSTIDNRAMKVFLEKMRPDTFLVLAGDTYQIESIDFGNWFTYAKDIIKTKGSNVELVSTWRTKDPGLIELWNETRNKGALITEKLVIDGPFSENIGEGVLNSEIMDEVILCLNYDGKFGLNNMNSYFQNANTETAVVWRDWKYKVGDHILFNDTDRFSLLYNNLKGQIVQIELFDSRIIFTVDVEIPLTEQDCQNDGIEFIDIIDDVTRIRFDVLDFEEEMADEDRKKAIVPFQLAYAVSIHKAQGLEYRSVKVVIPSSNAEKITHGIFYTAITRAKEKLKIYWSSETMQEVVAGFSVDTSRQKSLAIIKEKLKQDKNT